MISESPLRNSLIILIWLQSSVSLCGIILVHLGAIIKCSRHVHVPLPAFPQYFFFLFVSRVYRVGGRDKGVAHDKASSN